MAKSLLSAEGLSVVYRLPQGAPIPILDRVDLEIEAGSTLALVGKSGSGKSTLGRCLALLEEPAGGEIRFRGEPASRLAERRRRTLRRRIQLIFQDPAAALSPRFTARQAIAEPLRIARREEPAACRRRVGALMGEVAFPAELAERRCLELSGGQRQRLVIARALAAEPRVLILDEGLAALDLSLQAQVANLLLELQERRDLAYLLISHDLRLAAHLADRVAVLDRGRIVERATPAALFADPRHLATRALVRTMPSMTPAPRPLL